MNLVIPPVLFYAFGALLVSMGGVRAYYLGWRKRPELDDDDEADDRDTGSVGPEVSDEDVEAAIAGSDAGAATAAVVSKPGDTPDADVEPVETVPRRKVARTGSEGHKRHLVMGLLYVAMGLFLLVSTWVGQHRR